MISIKSESVRTTQYKPSANAIIDITNIVRNKLLLNNYDYQFNHIICVTMC